MGRERKGGRKGESFILYGKTTAGKQKMALLLVRDRESGGLIDFAWGRSGPENESGFERLFLAKAALVPASRAGGSPLDEDGAHKRRRPWRG